MVKPREDALEQARKMVKLYNELHKSDHIGLANKSLEKFSKKTLEDQVLRELRTPFLGTALSFSSELDRSVSELLNYSPIVSGLSDNIPAALINSLHSIEFDSIARSIRGPTAGLSQFAALPHAEIKSISEALREITNSYKGGFATAESLLHQLAERKQTITDAVTQMPAVRAFEMARSFAHLDVGDWEDIEELDEVETHEVQSRLIVVINAILSRLDPRNLSLSDYVAILLFIWASYHPEFTQEDREKLNEAAGSSRLAADKSSEAAGALEEIRQADMAWAHLIRHISELPRGQIIFSGNVRDYPSGSSKRVSVLQKGTQVAVSERKGRWRKIIFRDPLTYELSEGWIWGGSVEMFNDD